MITVKHKFIPQEIPEGKGAIAERCVFCGEVRYRRLTGRPTEPLFPCDWSKITDRETLARIINRHISFIHIRSKQAVKRHLSFSKKYAS